MKSIQIIGSLAIITALGLLSGCSQDDAAGATAGGASGNDSSSGNNGQIGNSQQTGKIAADGFFFLSDENPVAVYDEDNVYTAKEVTLTVFADDINDLGNVNGWTVNFKTEWGTFLDDKDSCVLENGSCSVKWRSGSPANAPGSCLVSFTAWAVGEENFADQNDNGELDVNEVFDDFEEPYLDIDENGTYTPIIATPELVTELIDVYDFDGSGGKNGVHDAGNGLYDGSFCASNNTASCSGRNSVVVHYRMTLLIKEPVTDVDDLDGDGDTTDKIIINCTANPY